MVVGAWMGQAGMGSVTLELLLEIKGPASQGAGPSIDVRENEISLVCGSAVTGMGWPLPPPKNPPVPWPGVTLTKPESKTCRKSVEITGQNESTGGKVQLCTSDFRARILHHRKYLLL